MGGGINLELLAKLQALEDQVSGLRQELSEVKSSRAGNDYGLVKLSSSQSITNSVGLALPASENNESINGTLANRVAVTNDRIRQIFSKTCIQNSGESEGGNGFNWIVGKTYTSTESFDNFSAFSMDLFWEGSMIFLPYYNNETDNLISGSVMAFTGQNYIRIKTIKIRYARGTSRYSIESAGIFDANVSGALNIREFKPGEVIDGFRLYGVGRQQ